MAELTPLTGNKPTLGVKRRPDLIPGLAMPSAPKPIPRSSVPTLGLGLTRPAPSTSQPTGHKSSTLNTTPSLGVTAAGPSSRIPPATAAPATASLGVTPRPRGLMKPVAPTTTSSLNISQSAGSVQPTSHIQSTASTGRQGVERYFEVMYCVRSNKKHKTYQDGFLEVYSQRCILKNDENKQVTLRMMQCSGTSFEIDDVIEIGTYEAVLQKEISVDDYRSGRPFTGVSLASNMTSPLESNSESTASHLPDKRLTAPKPTQFRPPTQAASAAAAQIRSLSTGNGVGTSTLVPSISSATTSTSRVIQKAPTPIPPGALVLNLVDPQNPTKVCPGEEPVIVDQTIAKHLRPHQREGVIFLYRSVMGLQLSGYQGCILADEMGLGKTLQTIALLYTLLRSGPLGNAKPVCRKALIVCPSTLTRNWQNEFKKWLGSYRLSVVVMGANPRSRSSLRADKEDETDDSKSTGSAHQKAIREEIAMFVSSTSQQVLIISYEMFRKHADALNQLPSTTLLVCDEGHRLKNVGGNKTIQALGGASCRKRVILSGTPVQNDLMEFYAMVDFINPGILGTVAKFRNSFEQPISKSRDASSTEKEREIGALRSAELSRLTSAFILRRTNALLTQYLPPKQEYSVFFPMANLQKLVYLAILQSRSLNRVLSASLTKGVSSTSTGPSALALRLLTLLKKVANHPSLIYNASQEEKAADDSSDQLDLSTLEGVFPAEYTLPTKAEVMAERAKRISAKTDPSDGPLSRIVEGHIADSGKLQFLASMLQAVRDQNDAIVSGCLATMVSSNSEHKSSPQASPRESNVDLEKVVVVSNYQETLNLIEVALASRGWNVLRLDGSTPNHLRQQLVDKFNAPLYFSRTSTREEFTSLAADAPWIFLLSSQAGGVGLNLTGANRLVLFEPNWNPAFDLQAMSRIWRDGQKKPCTIYRFFSASTIDEKIFQRQMRKGDLAVSILDKAVTDENNAEGIGGSRNDEKGGPRLTTKELKAIFAFTESPCSTFQTLATRARDDACRLLSSKSKYQKGQQSNTDEKIITSLSMFHEFFAPTSVISAFTAGIESSIIVPLAQVSDPILKQLATSHESLEQESKPLVSFVFRTLMEAERSARKNQFKDQIAERTCNADDSESEEFNESEEDDQDDEFEDCLDNPIHESNDIPIPIDDQVLPHALDQGTKRVRLSTESDGTDTDEWDQVETHLVRRP